MLQEAKVQYKTRNDNGQEIVKKEWYVVENCERFSDVEEKLFTEFDTYVNEFDVTDIKRSRIKELANSRDNDDDKLFMAELQDTFTTDEGVEKEIKYKILFFSLNIDTAMSYINQYIKQGYDLTLISLKKTKFIDVL